MRGKAIVGRDGRPDQGTLAAPHGPRNGPHCRFAAAPGTAIDQGSHRNRVISTLRPESVLSNPALPESFRLRSGNFNLLVLRLLDPRPEAVLPALGDQFRRAPGFLRFAPIVIGLQELDVPPDQVDFRGLIQGLHGLEIVPIGTVGGSTAMRQAAISAGLPPLRAAGTTEEEVPLAAPAPAAPAPQAAAPAAVAEAAGAPGGGSRPTMLVTDPVRSGQRIYAQGADLVVTATVNPGAEVIADGNVHIYGTLRGRAVAGASDNPEARIFALHFDPELVAIAGYYAVREGLGPVPSGRAVQVRLEGEQMRFEPLG
jgi:septum site-determining protein MinC